MFFFELWKYVNYNFIITFIVDNFVESFAESFVESLIKSSFVINKEILSIWHVWLEHLKEQNVRRLVKMSNEMNLIKFVANRNFCESCIMTKQKIESHNNFVIFDKHSLNLMWSDLVQSSYSTTKLNTLWRFYAILSNDQWFTCFVSYSTRLMFLNIFSSITSMKIIECVVFASIERKITSMTNLTIIALNTTLNENQLC